MNETSDKNHDDDHDTSIDQEKEEADDVEEEDTQHNDDYHKMMKIDQEHIWHPYSSMPGTIPTYLVESASGHELMIRCRRNNDNNDNNNDNKNATTTIIPVIDGMSSWWASIHGYNHPQLNHAITKQLEQMSHVMFGGLTHEPAIQLTETLLQLVQPPQHIQTTTTTTNSNSSSDSSLLQHVFYCDSGSVSVEVAMKMAIQYHLNNNTATTTTSSSSTTGKQQQQKTKFVSFKGGYHGDTFMTMSVCDPINGMHHLFSNSITQQLFVSRPTVKYPNSNVSNNCDEDEEEFIFDPDKHMNELRTVLELHHEHIAGLIIEPIVQGAGGMYFYHPLYLTYIRQLCTEYNIVFILDEIATGFGRIGGTHLFAFQQVPASMTIPTNNSNNNNNSNNKERPDEVGKQQHIVPSIVPDILCIGKALSGGYMSFAATIASTKIAEAFQPTTIHNNNTNKNNTNNSNPVLMHGPTYMGNPLACAVSLASIQLLLQKNNNSNWQTNVQQIETQFKNELAIASESIHVQNVRVLGAIGVIEMKQPLTYNEIQYIQHTLIHDYNVWLRPFGKLLYTMPPYNCPTLTSSHITQITKAMVSIAFRKR